MEIQRKNVFYEYEVLEQLEAGLVLEGWEVKAIRAGRAQMHDAYVKFIDGKPVLIGFMVQPLIQASTHVQCDQSRFKTVLLHKRESSRWMGKVERKGLSVVPLKLYEKRGRFKLEICLVRGKNQHDKRQSAMTADWKREQERLLKVRTKIT